MKYISRPLLMRVAEILKVYIAQDDDGFVQIWTRKPKRNLELGIWEGCDAPILNQDSPLLAPYTGDWERSLVTPRSRKLTNETWQEWLSEQGECMIKNVQVYGIADSFKASKYPMATDTDKCSYMCTDRIKKLASAPIGSGHDNFLNGVIVQFDLTFSQKAWVELQRYHFIDFVSSQSTMHRIDRFDLDSQMNEWVDEAIKDRLRELVEEYKKNKSHENFLKVIYNIPSGFQLTARMTTNYRQLKTIYFQRRTHRLPDWWEFCKWIEELPHMKKFLGLEYEL